MIGTFDKIYFLLFWHFFYISVADFDDDHLVCKMHRDPDEI